MPADFWAGYISGVTGIIIGNPLDILKVRLQATRTTSPQGSPLLIPTTPNQARGSPTNYLRPWLTGTAAPVLGYGAVNALLFMSYNRSSAALNDTFHTDSANLWTTWLAGAVGGLATWAVSTPTELLKCRAQLASPPASSFAIARQVLRTEGVRGLYFGGAVTALRDSLGYGFYFWSYALASRWMASYSDTDAARTGPGPEAAKVFLSGGLAGIVSWASIFPLDVIKTRMQAQVLSSPPPLPGSVRPELSPLLPGRHARTRLGAWEIAKETYREGGARPFLRGLAVCSVRAFIVNAVQWAVYEWIMFELGPGRARKVSLDAATGAGAEYLD